ncbi:MAG TPA: hypothetical protein VFS93_06975 [Terrimesophilobacter sp.]|nr:hypothetical protein [Terrimesophilobacter sp.]
MAKNETPAADGGPAVEAARKAPDQKQVVHEPAPHSVSPARGKAAGDKHETGSAKKLPWFRLTVIVLFALVYVWDLFEAISNLFGVAAQIMKYNENATLIGLNTIAIPWTVLIINLLLPPVVFGLALLVARRRNVGILAIVLLAGLGVVAAVSLSLAELVGVLS